MIRKSIAMLVATTGLTLGACAAPAASGAAPQAWIDAPLDGMRLLPAPYLIALHASDPRGVSQMEVTVNSDVLATLQNPDQAQLLVYMTQIWDPPAPGRYLIRVRAQNTAGVWSSEDRVVVEVAVPTATPSPTPTWTPTATLTPTATATMTPTPLAQAGFFGEPVFTPRRINLPYDCPTSAMTAEIGAGPESRIQFITLFFRVADEGLSDHSDWAALAMGRVGAEAYRLTFDPIADGGFVTWVRSHIGSSGAGWVGWLQTQFVIQDSEGGYTRSPVYSLVQIGGCR
jgi:hypothetical protein